MSGQDVLTAIHDCENNMKQSIQGVHAVLADVMSELKFLKMENEKLKRTVDQVKTPNGKLAPPALAEKESRLWIVYEYQGWAPGTEVAALHNYQGKGKDDLPFRKMEILTIVSPTQDPNWYRAKNVEGREGHIPANYVTLAKSEVKLQTMPWFHGKISREDGEELLKSREDGTFLVRESNNFPGDYTLCVCYQNNVEHYRVIYKDRKLTIDEEEFFDNLTELVEHYEKDADGLCSHLTRSVPKQGKLSYTVDSKAFEKAGWVFKRSDIQFGEALGKGEYGDVVLGNLKGQKVAVKIFKDNNKTVQDFLTEASVMTSLRHTNLVQLLGLVFDGDRICLVTEYMAKGSLVDYLRSRGRLHVSKRDQISYAYDACSGMAYLESKKVVHRDLAARNVLISDKAVAKVADFGLAREENVRVEGRVPIKWTAPEALKDGNFSSKSDMWSFGILLWEIYAFGRVPYPRILLHEVRKHVEKGYRMEPPEGCPPEVYEIMREAWEDNPDKRPTFSKTLQRLELIRNSLNVVYSVN